MLIEDRHTSVFKRGDHKEIFFRETFGTHKKALRCVKRR